MPGLHKGVSTQHTNQQVLAKPRHQPSERVHVAEKKAQKIKTQSDYLSDSKSSEDKVNPHLRTSQEERVYGAIKGSVQVTQAVLSHTTMQCNPTVDRGLLKKPKIKKLSKEQASDKTMQTKEKDKPL